MYSLDFTSLRDLVSANVDGMQDNAKKKLAIIKMQSSVQYTLVQLNMT